jgi:polyisoprenoid-binding protein YceI
MDSIKQHSFGRFLLARSWWLMLVLLVWAMPRFVQAQLYKLHQSQLDFVSDAMLEVISANNNQVQGLLDLEKRTFLVQVKIDGFKGFNSPLQQEHFLENYLEAHKFPKAVFSGKLIDVFNPSVPGRYEVRAKGQLDIHGVQRERIIKTVIEVKADRSISFSSYFTVLLDEHQILIPRIVQQKIAEEIKVSIRGMLKP